jgi:hypothetical protein
MAVAAACGFADCQEVADEAGLADLAGRLKTFAAPLFARVRIVANDPPRVLPERDGVELKSRFRSALGVKA